MPDQVIHLICAECGVLSEDEAERCRAYTAGGLEDEEPAANGLQTLRTRRLSC